MVALCVFSAVDVYVFYQLFNENSMTGRAGKDKFSWRGGKITPFYIF